MQTNIRARLTLCAVTTVALLAGCGGGGGGSSNPPPPPVPQAKTYSVTAIAMDLRRSADGAALPTDPLPVEGATLTVQ